jgi:hypothetical protein
MLAKTQNKNLRMLNGATLEILSKRDRFPPNAELIRDENGIATGGLAYRVEVNSDVKTSDRTTQESEEPGDLE